jgi:integrase/recombinase XerD
MGFVTFPDAQRMLDDLQMAGVSARTQQAYLGAVRGLAKHFHLSPDKISENQLRQYFLFVKNEKKLSAGSLYVI